MRDVFKYFKHVRSLQEDKGAEKAAELGYQHQARGVYIDPKTQKKYKNVGDKLEPIIDEPAAEKGSGEEKPAGKSLSQFKQDATGGGSAEQATKRGDIDPNNVEGGIPDQKKVEILAKGMSGGRWDTLGADRRETLMQAATEKLAQIQMQQAAAVEPEPEPEPEPQPEPVEEPAKAPEDFPTLDDKVKEVEKAEEKPKPTLSQFKQKTEKKPKKGKAPSIAEKKEMEAEMNLDDLLNSIRKDDSNIQVDHKDPDSIFVPQPVPDGKLKAAAVSTTTPSPIPPEPGEGIEEYDKRKDDGYGKNIADQKLQVPTGERRADYIFGDSKKTDLIGESAYMEAALKIFDGSYDADVLQMVGQKNLKPEDQKKVDGLLADIREAIPSKGLGKGWEESAARMVKLTTQHMDPNRKYKFGKSGDGTEGMRLTTVPQDMQDFTYDLANATIENKIGKTKLKELLGNDTAGIMDHYDPTDVVFFAEDAIEPFMNQVQSLSDAYDDGNPKTRDQDLLNGMRKLKQKFMEDKSLLPISLKKPKKGSDPHFIPRNVSGDYDEETMNSVSFDLMTEGKDGISWGFDGSRMGDLTDNFSMNFNMKDDVYSGNKFSMPVINHPGAGPHANDPFSRVANIKSEPSLKGGAEAKLGMLDTKWIGNKKVNEILGYNFEEKYGNRDDNLGINSKNKAERFSDEDRKVLKNLVKEVAEHEGSAKVNMKLPKGMDAEQFVDSLIDADDLIHSELEGKSIKKGKRGQDAMDINLDDEQKKRIKEKLGSIPDSNFRSKIRTKFRQLRYAKLLQELEKSGKLGDFGKEYIYKNTMKIGNEYSPFILLG
jgi:hypothetical protein